MLDMTSSVDDMRRAQRAAMHLRTDFPTPCATSREQNHSEATLHAACLRDVCISFIVPDQN